MDPASLIDLPTANPAAMRAKARALVALAEETRRLDARIDQRVRATPYEGAAAAAFRHRMAAHHVEALRVSAGLEEVAGRMAARASQLAVEQDALARAVQGLLPGGAALR